MRVFLRSEANSVNSFMSSSDKAQLRNARVFSNGEDVGFESKVERGGTPGDPELFSRLPGSARGGTREHW